MSTKDEAMMRGFIATLLLLLLASAFSEVRKTTERESTGINGLECKIERTRTSKSEGLRDRDIYYFRTTNKKSATIKLNLDKCKFNNCRAVATRTFASRSGEWSTGGLIVEALSHVAWSCKLNYSVSWK